MAASATLNESGNLLRQNHLLAHGPGTVGILHANSSSHRRSKAAQAQTDEMGRHPFFAMKKPDLAGHWEESLQTCFTAGCGIRFSWSGLMSVMGGPGQSVKT